MNLELLRDTMRGSRYFLVALLIVTALDAGVYLYRAFHQEPELERMRSAYQSSRSAGADGTSQRAALYESALRDLATFQGRLIPKREFAGFLDALFTMAQKHSVAVKGISYKPGTEKGAILSYGMSLQVNGRYADLKGLLADLMHYPRMVSVDAVSLRNGSLTQESVDLQLQITAFLKTEGA